MTETSFRAWLGSYDPADQDAVTLLERFVFGLRDSGVDINRCSLWLPTAHPELWGQQLIWEKGETLVHRREHGITSTDTYRNTPAETVHQEKRSVRVRLSVPDEEIPYPMLRELKEAGATDYLIVPFHTDHEVEQPWIAFSTLRDGGFLDAEIAELHEFCVLLGWKARTASAESATRSLLEVYLGKNAAARVMKGQFRRGTGETLKAAIWFCDLRGFTNLGDGLRPAKLVETLDAYFESVAGPIEDGGGEILKFIGDAVLAVFPMSDENAGDVCRNALEAAMSGLQAVATWSKAVPDRPPLEIGIALHVGEVFYGNIGGRSRLDFTVIGAAVNETSRIESLCKEMGPLLTTRQFADLAQSPRLKSIGSRELRGVRESVEIFAPSTL